jgi:hypothetical protein
MRKKLIVIAAAGLVGFLAIGAAAALLIDVDRFRPQLAHALSGAAGRDVAIGHISMSLFAGTAVVDDLSIADDAAFGGKPFVTAKSVRVGIAVLPLITSKRLQVESLRLQQPRVTLRRSAAGVWNFSTLGAVASAESGAAASPSTGTSQNLNLSIDRLTVSNGEVSIETAGSRERHVYDKLSVDIRNFSATQKFPFAMSLATPGGGALKMTGHAGPLNPSGIGATPMDASVDATRVDIAKAGVIDPRAGLGGIFDLHLSIASTGTRLTTTGTLRADKLQLVPGASPATRAIDVSYASEYEVERHEGAVTKGELRVGKATAQLTGRFTTREAAPVVRVTLSGRAMPVPDLEALLPAIGATLPRGAHFRGGTLDVGFTANGGVDRLVTAGQLVMTNATIAGFDLGTQMKAVATLAGVGRSSDTTIESLRTAPNFARGHACRQPHVHRPVGGPPRWRRHHRAERHAGFQDGRRARRQRRRGRSARQGGVTRASGERRAISRYRHHDVPGVHAGRWTRRHPGAEGSRHRVESHRLSALGVRQEEITNGRSAALRPEPYAGAQVTTADARS